MPSVVPYEQVAATLAGLGCVCGYPNGGVWSPGPAEATFGYLTGDDATLRPGLDTRVLDDPTPAGLAAAFAERCAGEIVWLMPGHHWAYELQHGGKSWAAEWLASLGIDPATLRGRTVADAVAFEPGEREALRASAETLWAHLDRSDFAAALPGARPVATALLHHHGQLWWRTALG